MRKNGFCWIVIPCVCLLLLLVGSLPASAHTTTPTVSGGGCTAKVSQGPSTSFAQYASCISFIQAALNDLPHLAADAYFNFGAASPALWTYCKVTIDIVDESTNVNGTTVDTSSTDCLNDARANTTNAHYVNSDFYIPTGGDNYAAKVGWTGIYNGKVITGISFFSPVLFN